jgi:hypothetical protein
MSMINFKVSAKKPAEVSEGSETSKEEKGPMKFTIKGNLSQQVTTMLNEEFDRRKPATEDMGGGFMFFDDNEPSANIVHAVDTGATLSDIRDTANDIMLDVDKKKNEITIVLNPTGDIHPLIPSLEEYAKENNVKVFYSLESFVNSMVDKACTIAP